MSPKTRCVTATAKRTARVRLNPLKSPGNCIEFLLFIVHLHIQRSPF
ncbi:hypothetical protein NG796_04155 [Laspinema sp. A4]|nr:hypothetical protein [Laspinema sp. D2d]MCT7982479.1 hypothetical protein [Laspinema sp. D2d]